MKPRQYKPYSSAFKIPRIIYPVKDENPLRDVYKNEAEITAHLDELTVSMVKFSKKVAITFYSSGIWKVIA